MSSFVEVAKNAVADMQPPMYTSSICNCILGALCASWLVTLAVVQQVHLYIFESHRNAVKLSSSPAKTRVLRETFDAVMQTDASSALLVQTKSLVVDSFFKGSMLGRPFIMHGKSASESVRLLTHVRQLAVDPSRGHMEPSLQTQLQRCDGSVIDVELVAEWIPPEEGCGRIGNFLFGLRVCRSSADGVDTTASLKNELCPNAVDLKLHDDIFGSALRMTARESSGTANHKAERKADRKNKSQGTRNTTSCYCGMPTIVETEEEYAVGH